MYLFLPDALKSIIFSFLTIDELLLKVRLIDIQSQQISLHHLFERTDESAITQQFRLLNQWLLAQRTKQLSLTSLKLSAFKHFFDTNNPRAIEHQETLLQEWLKDFHPLTGRQSTEEKTALRALLPTFEAKLKNFLTNTMYKNHLIMLLAGIHGYPLCISEEHFGTILDQLKTSLATFSATPFSNGSTYQRPKKIVKDSLTLLTHSSAYVLTAKQINLFCQFIHDAIKEHPKGAKPLLLAFVRLTNFLPVEQLHDMHALLMSTLCHLQSLSKRHIKKMGSDLTRLFLPTHYQAFIATFFEKIQSNDPSFVLSNEALFDLFNEQALATLHQTQVISLSQRLIQNFRLNCMESAQYKPPLSVEKLTHLYQILSLVEQQKVQLSLKDSCYFYDTVDSALSCYFQAWQNVKNANAMNRALRAPIQILQQITPLLFSHLEDRQRECFIHFLTTSVIKPLKNDEYDPSHEALITSFFFSSFHLMSALSSKLSSSQNVDLANLMLYYQKYLVQTKEKKAFLLSLQSVLKHVSPEAFFSVANACVDCLMGNALQDPLTLSLFTDLIPEQKQILYCAASARIDINNIDINNIEGTLKITAIFEDQKEFITLITQAVKKLNESLQDPLMRTKIIPYAYANEKIPETCLSFLIRGLSSSHIRHHQKNHIFQTLNRVIPQLESSQQDRVNRQLLRVFHETPYAAVCELIFPLFEQIFYVLTKKQWHILQKLGEKIFADQEETAEVALKSFNLIYSKLITKRKKQFLDHTLHGLHSTQLKKYLHALNMLRLFFPHLQQNQRRKVLLTLCAHFNTSKVLAYYPLLSVMDEMTAYVSPTDLAGHSQEEDILHTCSLALSAALMSDEEAHLGSYFQLLKTLVPVLNTHNRVILSQKIFEAFVQEKTSVYVREGLEILSRFIVEGYITPPRALPDVLSQLIASHAEEKTKSLAALNTVNQIASKLPKDVQMSLGSIISQWVDDPHLCFRKAASQFTSTLILNTQGISNHPTPLLFFSLPPKEPKNARTAESLALQSNLLFFTALKHAQEKKEKNERIFYSGY